MASGFAENRIAGALGCEAPVVAGGVGNTGHRKRIRIWIGRGIDAITRAPSGAAEIVASAAAANGVRLIAQIVSDHDGKSVGGEIVDGDRIGCTLSLLNPVYPIDDVNPVAGPV